MTLPRHLIARSLLGWHLLDRYTDTYSQPIKSESLANKLAAYRNQLTP